MQPFKDTQISRHFITFSQIPETNLDLISGCVVNQLPFRLRSQFFHVFLGLFPEDVVQQRLSQEFLVYPGNHGTVFELRAKLFVYGKCHQTGEPPIGKKGFRVWIRWYPWWGRSPIGHEGLANRFQVQDHFLLLCSVHPLIFWDTIQYLPFGGYLNTIQCNIVIAKYTKHWLTEVG